MRPMANKMNGKTMAILDISLNYKTKTLAKPIDLVYNIVTTYF